MQHSDLSTQQTQPRVLKLAGGALNQTPLDWDNNLRNIQAAIEKARSLGVEILCLPEMCLTGYGCEDLFLNPWLSEAAWEKLQLIPAWTEGITVALGLPVRFEGQLHNCACLIKDRQILGFTAKQYLANDGVHYETRWFVPWKAGFAGELEVQGRKVPFGDVVYDLPGGVRLGFEICEDAWRPEPDRPACRLLERGVNLILNPSASHFGFSKTDVRENRIVLEASRRFNCAYLYVNLLGNEAGRMIYDGEVMIAQHGRLIQKNNLLSFADIDVSVGEVVIGSRAPDQPYTHEYQDQDKCQEFTAALTLAMFDYLRKSRSAGFVLSLSGGADSCLCAVAVAEMIRRGVAELGVERFCEKLNMANNVNLQELHGKPYEEVCRMLTGRLLTCAYQASANSSDDTFNSAKNLADSLGATFYHWTIDEEVAGYTGKIEQNIGRQLTWERDDLTLQNIQARVRAPAIWMLANLNNALLLATSNRSEASVGYATMDGDTAGSISPIAGVDKSFIREWLRWAELQLGYPGLQHVNALQPTAELRPGTSNQTDETDLMPYPVLNAIERAAFYDRLSPVKVWEKLRGMEPDDLLAQHLRKFYQLWTRNQWKRERYAPAFHLDDYNVDPRSWLRFPILSSGFKTELAELEQHLREVN